MIIADDDLDEVLRVDLADPALYAGERPERIWRTLRRGGAPVRSRGEFPYWVLTRYAHIESVYRAPGSFSSEKGMQLGVERSSAQLAAEAAAGKMLIVSDDPAHTEIRKAIGAAFQPRMIRLLTDATLAVARELVSAAARGEPVDFVDEVSARLPATVICDLLGVPSADRAYVSRVTQAAFGDPGTDHAATQVAAHTELLEYCDQLITSKRRDPGEDVATALATATLGGRPMSQEVAVLNCHGLISGGNETTRHAGSVAALSMVTWPRQWELLRAGAVPVDDAAEELLRFASPANHVMRVATADHEVGGETISAGEFVTLWLGSANRDEDVFGHPDDLDFTRRPNRHLTFGLGGHFCLGAFLARLELRSLVQALLEHVDAVAPAGEPRRLVSNFLRGYTHLPLILDPR
ncbi:cytochrome P450 [Amycolatopsis sp. cmx-4-54]|uniref:cytochrome P450 n=1 Tax=Amycolatopsis sp. cmx-4-54 TaxID=2790936 RepID=UPI00397D3891